MKKRLTGNIRLNTSRLKLLTLLMILVFFVTGCTSPKVLPAEINGEVSYTASAAETAALPSGGSPTPAVSPEITTSPDSAEVSGNTASDPANTPAPVTAGAPDNVTPAAVKPDTSSDNSASATQSTDKEPAEHQKAASQVTLLAVGDNLIHSQIIKSGRQADGTLNYDHLYANLKDMISAADIAVINQETILGGKQFKYSGYPNFNSPTEIGDAVINAGFDVVLHASNHTMDQGLAGVENDLAFWKLHPEITVLGINETKKQREEIPVIEKNGIRIAMLNYTYGLNGHTVPKGKPYLVDMLDKDAMKEDIKKAKKAADFVIVFPHWGTEYVYEATKTQKDLTQFFYEQGVDLVIGTHPHVLEPVEWIGTDKSHRMLVYYSLGNFVSYQREAPRMLGGIANITITKDDSGTYISSAGITPIVTHYENGSKDYNYGIYKLTDYSQKLAAVHGILGLETKGTFTYQGTCDLAKQILGSWFQPNSERTMLAAAKEAENKKQYNK